MATTSYSQGWLAGASWTQNSVTTPLLAAVSYTGASGALGAITSATVGQSAGAALYHTATQLDSDGRPTSTTLSRVSDGTTLSSEQLSYDAVGNVAAVSTTLPQGTDSQAFCYDEQNRLTWAGTTSGNPCGNPATTGSFGGANYTQAFSYDTLNRLTSGPLGSYTYGDSAHLHAATSVSSGYTATYDAAGDMLCRAPSSSTTCAGGSPTGQQLTWDAEGQLAAWQNAQSSPTTTAKYLYDGEGNRVVQQVSDTAAGTTTTTSYVGSLETITNNGATITTTDYAAAGPVRAVSVNGALSYLATNYQGSVVEALDGNGVVTASQLYSPYGGVRYANGSMPTDYGYTGQRSDASTGLDYYGARYYDPTLGQFTAADTLLAGGLNRYGYVSGNPTTATDPSGHFTPKGDETIGSDEGKYDPKADPSTANNGTDDGGGGGTLPPLPLPLLKALIGAGILLVRHFTDGSSSSAPPAATASEPDEMSRANARNKWGVSLSDLPYWNRHNVPNRTPTHDASVTETSTSGGGALPQEAGGGAGTPNEPRSPVANTPQPEDDNGCGCGDDPTIYLHHGTSLENAESIMQNGIDVSRLSNGAFYATRDVLAAQGFAARAVAIGNAQAILVYGIAQSVLNTLVSGGLAREQPMNFPYADQTEFVFQEGAFDTLNASVYGIYEPVDGKLRFRPC